MQRPLRAHSRTLQTRLLLTLVIATLCLGAVPQLIPPAARAQDVATYIAEKHICPAEFDPSSSDASTALATCTEPAPGVGFTLSSADPNYPGDSRSTDGGGVAAWNDIPLGTAYSVSEAIPQGYSDPWVYCEVTGGPGGDQFSYFPAGGGVMDVGLTDPSLTGYTQAYCRWFNIPLPGSTALQIQEQPGDITTGEIEPAGVGRVILRKYFCPTGFELIDPALSRSNGDCAIDGPDPSYTLTYGPGTTSEQPLGPNQTIIWTDIPAGTIQIAETPVEGYETLGVYCSTAPEGTTPTVLEDAWSPEDKRASYQLQDGYAVVCEWFNLRLPQRTDAGSVVIGKSYCPPGYVAPEEGADYSSNDCNGTGPDGAFALTIGGQPVAPAADRLGYDAAWTGVPGGQLSIEETPPPGYVTAGVFCNSFPGTDPNNPNSMAAIPVRAEHTGNTMTWDFQDGYYLFCNWLNVPTEDASGDLYVSKKLCPDGYDVTSKTLDDLLDACAENQTGVDFELSVPNNPPVQATTTEGGRGAAASFPEQPIGLATVTEIPSGDYHLAAVFCSYYPRGEQTPLFDSSNFDQETVTSGGFPVDIRPEVEIACFAFDVPGQVAAGPQAGSVTIKKYECPPGFASTNPGVGGYSGFCNPSPAGVTFTASQGGAPVASAPTDETGLAVLTGIAPGTVSISELPREGYDPPRVYCSQLEVATGTPGNLEEQTVTNWSISYDLADGYALDCVWYNLPAAVASTDPGTILIRKHICPEGTEDANQSLEELTALCTDRPDGVEFNVRPPLTEGGTTVGTALGDALFPNVAPGSLWVEEIFNQGYAPLRAFCNFYLSSGSPGDYLPVGLSGNLLTTYLAAGYILDCYWFDVPFVEPGEIEVLKYVCPETYGIEGAAREDVLFNCATPAPGVRFELTGPEGFTASAVTGTDSIATFAEIPPNPVILAERAVSYETLKVYCGTASVQDSNPPATWTEPPITDESINFSVQPGVRVTCYWINRAVDYPDVIVHKYACDGAHPDQPEFEAVLQSCATPLDGVEFSLTAESQTETQTTDTGGNASWNQVPEGDVTLTETPPEAYPLAIVFCAEHSAGGELGEYRQEDVEQYTIVRHRDGGYYLECFWFDFAEQLATPSPQASPTTGDGGEPTGGGGTSGGGETTGTGGTSGGSGGQQGGQQTAPTAVATGPATLIITKYTCPPGYDVLAPDADAADDCDTLTDEIDFTLTVEGADEDAAETRTTGADEPGMVRFDDLEPGAYLLRETLPDGIASAFILSCESDQREFAVENPFQPFAFAGPDGRIGVVLVSGETLACDWYDVPAGLVTVTVYQCPGTLVNVASCELVTDPVTIAFTPVSGGEPVSLTTDQTGAGSVSLDEGAYTLSEEGGTPCLIDSDAFDEEGNLVVEGGGSIEVRVYNCT